MRWKLVPVEANLPMGGENDGIQNLWQAMLSAAPDPAEDAELVKALAEEMALADGCKYHIDIYRQSVRALLRSPLLRGQCPEPRR